MSDSQSWYQRKLAAVRQQAPPPPQPQQVRPLQEIPPNQQQQFVQFQPQGQQVPRGAVNMGNFWDMMQLWKGGKAHQIDRDPCPECGSDQYYSRTSGPRRGPPPAPHCFQCGYNGLFEQGLPSSWQPG